MYEGMQLPRLIHGNKRVFFGGLKGCYKRVKKHSGNSGEKLKTLLPKYFHEDSSQLFLFDSSFLDPIDPLKFIALSLKRKYNMSFDEMLGVIRITYGQIKSVNNLAESGNVITHQSTLDLICIVNEHNNRIIWSWLNSPNFLLIFP